MTSGVMHWHCNHLPQQERAAVDRGQTTGLVGQDSLRVRKVSDSEHYCPQGVGTHTVWTPYFTKIRMDGEGFVWIAPRWRRK